MMADPFETPIVDASGLLTGPFRAPRNMLAEQTYGGHASIHDDGIAQNLGFKAAAIEGPTHYSQFVPLAVRVWGERFLREGCLSVSYKTACHEGEEVQAVLAKPCDGENLTEIWMVRADGAEVLRGTASVGGNTPPTALDVKVAALPAPDPLRVIHRGVVPGTRRDRIPVRLGMSDVMGALYPFSLRQKLAAITEPSPLYQPPGYPAWGPIIPFEMVSVLVHHVADSDPWQGEVPTIDMFVDQEIRMVAGPLIVDEPYEIERTVVALSGSRRTESIWVRTEVFHPGGNDVLASMLLNVASFKESYPSYEMVAAAIQASAG